MLKNKDWQTVKLGDVVDSISETHKFPKKSVIFFNTSDISNGKVLHHNSTDLTLHKLPGQAKKSIKKDDILFSEIRPINKRFAYVNFDADDYVVSTKLLVLRNKSPKTIFTKYFYIWITSVPTLSLLQIIAESRSGTFPQITYDIIKNIEIPLPPLEEQERIAEILSSFDDKIEINHKICADLESMAQVLFRENFIKNPARDTWGTVSLSDVADVRSSKRVFRDEYVPEGIPFYRGKEITELSNRQKISIPLFISYERYNELKSTSIIPQLGDILLTSVGTIGNVYLVDNSNPFYFKDGNITWIRDFSDNKLSKYILYWLTSSLGKKEIQAKLIGSTQQALTIDAIKTFNFSLPPQELLEKFENIVSPMYEQIKNLQKENIHLTETRDMLLPRLMKGEV